MSSTHKDLKKITIFLILLPILIVLISLVLSDFLEIHTYDFIFYTQLYILTGYVITLPYLISLGLSYRKKWVYQASLNAPFFLPWYVVINVCSNLFFSKEYKTIISFLDASIKDKRLDEHLQ
jgi:hypothetical protein